MVLSEHLSQMVLSQNESRKNWVEHDTAPRLDDYIRAEYKEFEQEILKIDLGNDPIEIAGEIGDVLYLWEKRKKFQEPVPVDVVEMIMEVQEICRLTGLDPEDCVRMKAFRNDLKYPQVISNNGYGYERGRKLSKNMWGLMGGDFMFYAMYSEMAEELID